jgi:Skp family chaperone for outer membrane proteins
MTPEEIKKQVDDEVKKATEKLEQEKAELQKKLDDAKIDEMKKENEELKKKVEELEKASKGSQQGDEPGKGQEVKKGCPPWLGPLG